MKTRVWLWMAAALVTVTLAVAGWTAYQNQQATKQAEKAKKDDVPLVFQPREVTRPVMAALPVTVEISGPLVAPSTAVVRAKAAGTLLSLAVAEGDRVKVGQVLGRVDTSDIDNRLAERVAMLQAMRAQAAQAKRTHDANTRLSQENFISGSALEASRVALDAASANVRATEAQLGSVRAAAKLATLVAPIEGIVAKRHVVPGEKLTPEQAVITVVDVRTLELAGSVGTHEVGLLKPGLAMQVSVEGSAKPVPGPLSRIAPAAEVGTRSIAVVVKVANADERFRAGQYALASVILPGDAPRLTVPATALSSTAGQDHVWLIEGGVLVRRAVTTGLVDKASERVEVLQGLTVEHTVLALKFDNLREGRKASVAASTMPVAAPTSTSVK
jgi:membrane fusion protein, multidrug efflux system